MRHNCSITKMKNLLYGVGIDDNTNPKQWKENGITVKCQYNIKWRDMIKRCYSEKWHLLYPTYINCTVCDEWLTFSNFKNWMMQQDWVGKQLDKDFLSTSKIYSPETCVFIPKELNVFITLSNKSRGDLPIGVGLSQTNGKYRAHIHKKNLGTFDTIMEAHKAWQNAKLLQAVDYHDNADDSRVKDGLQRIINSIQYDIDHDEYTTKL